MNWIKRKITIWTAEGSDFKIAESDEVPGRPYRLDSVAHLDDEPIYFASLRSAQAHAGTLAELAQLRAENARLRLSSGEGRVGRGETDPVPVSPLSTLHSPLLEDGDEPAPDDWDGPGGGPAPF